MNWLKEHIFFIIAIVLVMMLFFFGGGAVHAEELPEEIPERSQEDAYQDERLNNLELRLEELGLKASDQELTIEALQTALAESEEQKLAISEKLDLVIVALNDLVNYDIELLGKTDDAELLTAEYRELVTTSLATLENNTNVSIENTVSGNSLISEFADKYQQASAEIAEEEKASSETLEQIIAMILVGFGLCLGVACAIQFAKGFKGHGN